MVGKAFPRREAGHADAHARLSRIVLRVFSKNLSHSADCRVEQPDVNIVMLLRLFFGPDSFERSAFHSASTGPHFSQRMVTPSLVAPKSESPRKAGTDSSRPSTRQPEVSTSNALPFSYLTPSFCWIFSREMPLVSGMIKSTQISCPTVQSA